MRHRWIWGGSSGVHTWWSGGSVRFLSLRIWDGGTAAGGVGKASRS